MSAYNFGERCAVLLLLAVVLAGCGPGREASQGVALIPSQDPPTARMTFDLRFDQLMVTGDQIGKPTTNLPLVIVPRLPGGFVWLSPRSGTFVPEGPLALDTGYEFTLQPGLKAADGGAVKASMRRVVTTPPFELAAFTPQRPSTNATAEPEVKLVFNARVRAAEAARYIEFIDARGERIAADARQGAEFERLSGYEFASVPQVGWDEVTAPGPSASVWTNPVPTLIIVTPRQPLPIGRNWKVVIGAGMPALDSRLHLHRSAQVAIGDVTPFEVTEVTAHNLINSGPSIQLQFSKALADSLTNQAPEWVTLTPAPTNLAIGIGGNRMTLRGEFKSGTEYTLKLRAGLPANEPFTLAKPGAYSVIVPPVAPRLYFPAFSTDQMATGQRTFPLLAVNVPRMRVRAKLLEPAAAIHALRGPMRYRLALANSLNISAVKVLASLGGPAPLQERLRACGLTTVTRPAEEYGLGLTIGNAEARLLELANAYACLARLGEYKPYNLVLGRRAEDTHRAVGQTYGLPVNASSGGVSLLGKDALDGFGPTGPEAPSTGRPEVCPTKPVRVAEAGAAYLIADILSDNDARALAFGADSPLRFSFPVACKTGTSSDFRDNWAFGYTPEFTVGIWVGNFDGTPMEQVSGVTGAAPILHELFEHLHQRHGTSWYTAPANLVECAIDPVTGKRLEGGRRSVTAIREKFLSLALPPFCRGADYDSAGRVRLGGEYRDWLAGADNWLSGRAVAEDASRTICIAFPPPGTTLYLDPDLPGQGRRLTLRAEGPEDLRWESDSLTLVKETGRQVALLTAGRHQIRLSDPRTGAQAETWIEVLAR